MARRESDGGRLPALFDNLQTSTWGDRSRLLRIDVDDRLGTRGPGPPPLTTTRAVGTEGGNGLGGFAATG